MAYSFRHIFELKPFFRLCHNKHSVISSPSTFCRRNYTFFRTTFDVFKRHKRRTETSRKNLMTL